MFLILEDRPTCFTKALAGYAARKGFTPVILSSRDLSQGVVSYQVNHLGEEVLFEKGDLRINGTDVDGCICSINTFSPSLWPSFTEHDATYAAAESHAMWLSILHSLKLKMVNNPSPDSLSGKAFSPTELYAKASEYGLNIPMLLYTESSDAVKELLETGHSLMVSNLGNTHQSSVVIGRANQEKLPDSDNCHLVTEILSGTRYCVCFAGETLMVSTGISTRKVIQCENILIPGSVLEGLKKLTEDLELKLCEFILVKTYRDEWVLQSAGGIPAVTWQAWGDSLLQAVLEIPLDQTIKEGSKINV